MLTLIFSGLLVSIYAADSDLKELRSDHFAIFSSKNVDESYVYKIKDMAEDFYRSITQEFNLVRDKLWLWENRAKIFIAKDKEDYLRRFPCPSWSAACVDYVAKTIYTYPYQEGFSSNLAHELTHIIFREYVGRGMLPVWFDEGIAVYVQNKYGAGRRLTNFALLKKAIQDKKYIPLSELNSVNPGSLNARSSDYVNLFYIESFSLIDFLIKKGSRDNFYRFLYLLRSGNNFNDALLKSYSSIRNMEDLEKQWIRFYQE
ncbi:MAG: peptidase MA family metallohydrolase [Candidatus Omnitrophota bacterium]|nr:peptidase MA family metallohydrolase [Candidatus Omnitrophota bacterium]